jgi:hypothetical protein
MLAFIKQGIALACMAGSLDPGLLALEGGSSAFLWTEQH